MADELIGFVSPTTTLEAVNILLKAIGEAAVSDLTETAGSADVEAAFTTLQEVSRSVQMEGWTFNTEEEYPIAPDVDGCLTLPAGTLKVDTTGVDRSVRLVMRGNRLYDRRNHTYVFDRPYLVNLVVLLPFEDLPEVARNYITIKAARRFSDDELGSDTVHRFKISDEEEARVMMEQFDVEDDDTSLKDSPFFEEHLLRGRPFRRS